MQFDTNEIVQEAIEFADAIKEELGYDEVDFHKIEFNEDGLLKVKFICNDDFQARIIYTDEVQHGFVTFPYPFTTTGLKNREERELAVLLKQQSHSTELRDKLVSAEGRRYMEQLIRERSRYAQLVDMRDA